MPKTQEERMKELLDKYASFLHQTSDEKIKIVRLCGILAYLEAMCEQQMTVEVGIKQLEKFLDKLIKPYVGGDDKTEGKIIT